MIFGVNWGQKMRCDRQNAAAKPGPFTVESCRHLDPQHHFVLKANIVPTRKDQPLPVSDLFPKGTTAVFPFC